MKFTDEHKEEMAQGDYFELGVHLTKIMLVVFDKTDDGKEFVEFTVTDETETKEGKARLWFTTDKAGKYAFNIIRGIFVHNAGDDKKKEAIRKKIDAVKDTTELEKVCELLIGKEAWYEVSEDPNRTYEKDGKTYKSFNRNITGYEPTPKKVTAEAEESSAPATEDGDDQEELMPKDF